MVHVRGAKLQQALADVLKTLDQLDRRLEKMETILLVREPGSVAAAEAYEGLRRQVVNAVSERLLHLSQLVQFDVALRQGATADEMVRLLDGWLEQASLRRVVDPHHAEHELLYDLVSDAGGPLEILAPAYVDSVNGRVIRTGRARRGPVRHSPIPTPTVAGTAHPTEPVAEFELTAPEGD